LVSEIRKVDSGQQVHQAITVLQAEFDPDGLDDSDAIRQFRTAQQLTRRGVRIE